MRSGPGQILFTFPNYRIKGVHVQLFSYCLVCRVIVPDLSLNNHTISVNIWWGVSFASYLLHCVAHLLDAIDWSLERCHKISWRTMNKNPFLPPPSITSFICIRRVFIMSHIHLSRSRRVEVMPQTSKYLPATLARVCVSHFRVKGLHMPFSRGILPPYCLTLMCCFQLWNMSSSIVPKVFEVSQDRWLMEDNECFHSVTPSSRNPISYWKEWWD